MSGEQIQALVYELGPLNPKGLGHAVEIVAILLGVVCALVVSLRVYVRAGLSGASTRTWGVEDYLAVIGTVSLPARLKPLVSAVAGRHTLAELAAEITLVTNGVCNSFRSYHPSSSLYLRLAMASVHTIPTSHLSST